MHARREAPLWDMSNWIGNVGFGMLCGGGGCLSGGHELLSSLLMIIGCGNMT